MSFDQVIRNVWVFFHGGPLLKGFYALLVCRNEDCLYSPFCGGVEGWQVLHPIAVHFAVYRQACLLAEKVETFS